MKKLAPFRPKLITTSFFHENVSSPQEINCGRCFVWAYLAFKVFKGVQLWNTSIHAFVRYQGKFYDSEALRGVQSAEQLPIHKRQIKRYPTYRLAYHKRTEAEFKFEWGYLLSRLNLYWPDLSDQAQEVLRKYNDKRRV